MLHVKHLELNSLCSFASVRMLEMTQHRRVNQHSSASSVSCLCPRENIRGPTVPVKSFAARRPVAGTGISVTHSGFGSGHCKVDLCSQIFPCCRAEKVSLLIETLNTAQRKRGRTE